MILMSVLVGVFVSCDAFDSSSLKESEQVQETSTANETESVTETETENPYSMSKVVDITLYRYSGKGSCSIRWDDRKGMQGSRSLMGVTRFLYRTQMGKVYNEISLSDIGSADGTGISIREDNELLHLIVVFKKDYKLTEFDKTILKETGIDYMFEN